MAKMINRIKIILLVRDATESKVLKPEFDNS